MTISVVVPCFNEEESIPLFYREMERVRMKMGEKFEYIFINAGSSDGTLSVLRSYMLQIQMCTTFLFLEISGKRRRCTLDLNVLMANM